ncbi:MAG TPA: ATP-binding protein [Rhodocyclaceae bacterium]|nr:ATP-binding protein [Rhodocyclaceae bacterium]
MPSPTPLALEALYTACDPAVLGFATTDEVADVEVARIHGRAVEAMGLGLGIKQPGYNLFLLGDIGSGRHAIVKQLLEAERQNGTPPADWCYVNDFSNASHCPLLKLPAGRGAKLRDDMQRFVDELAPAIGAVFERDEYRERIESLQTEEKQREDDALHALGREAKEQYQVQLLRTPHGFVFAPMKDEETPLSPDEYEKLPEAQQKAFAEHMELLHERLHKLVNEFPHWRRELQNQMKAAGSEALRMAVLHLIDELKASYADLPEVVNFLDGVLQDILQSGEKLRESTKSDEDEETTYYSGSISIQRYLVNLLVANTPGEGRPAVVEDHPTLQNLVGRIDHLVHQGTLISNFTLIKAGALHRANGGFLVLDAIKVLTQPYAWDGLKRALKSGQVKIESLSELIGISGTLQLEPEPVPLDLKVVLIGERVIYYLLSELDPDFPALFKINADMESEVERSPDNTQVYARLIATLARRGGCRPLTAAAVARVVEHGARLANDAERLTTCTEPMDNLMREAEHFATHAQAPLIEREHIEAALAAQRRRHERVRQRSQEEILRGQWLVDTTGSHAGQINGLAVVPLGDGTFGHPVRITATVRMGEGEVIDVEREVDLGGPIHSKGVLILSSFLASRFGRTLPLSLKASLVFEQSYGGVEGDSASLAELAALLSALSGLPLRQSLAVTGSVNQFGVVQAVGGINEKIEGFFDICDARGLTGDQGVLIPATNVCHLMLKEEVVAAAKEGRFHIWPVTGIDDAMEILAGLPAGAPDDKGIIREGTVNFQIALALADLAHMRQDYLIERKRRKKKKAAAKTAPSKPPAVPPTAPPEKDGGEKG